ncbi:MAG: lipase family protein [Hassallia sp.]
MKEILVHAYERAKGSRVKEHVRHVKGAFSGLSLPEAAQVAAHMASTGLAPGSPHTSAVKLRNVKSQAINAHVSHLGAELLAKAAYETSEQGASLPAGYRVAEKFADPKTGLAVSVFVSPSSGPVVAFRGTEGNGDVRDMLTDFDPRGVGFGQFQGNKQALSVLAQKYPGATVTGHSLGGALAQRYAAEFNNASEVVTFNAPGVDKGTAAKFQKGKTKVTHYVSHGDPVSLGGEKFIDGEAKIISYKSGKIPIVGNTLDKHMAAIAGGLIGNKDASVKTITSAELSNPNFKYGGRQITSFSDRRAIENRRKLAGVVTSPLNPLVGMAGQALGMIGIGNK